MKTKLFSLALALLMSVSLFALSGTCGPNLTWTLNFQTGVLTISGSGNMDDYSWGAPWYSYRQSITSIAIGNSVTSIGDAAFAGCSGLTSITIPNDVTSIGHYAFRNCSGLTSITIPNSVTSIGGLAFSGCSGLTSVTIPNSVTSIGAGAFSYCSGLTSVTIGNSVTSIRNYAFGNCRNLDTIYCMSSIPPVTSYNTFSGVNQSTCTLYVPNESIDEYKNDSGWRDFYNIQGFDPKSAIENVSEESTTRKLLRNGKLYILLPDGTRYDATGKKVE